MEKLIELLNESAVLDTIFENGYQIKFRATKIISKELGFIKWLVDNDKIDYDKVDKSWNDEMSFVDFKLDNIMEIRVKVVLMLLAISDTPINLLCSLLK